MFLRMTLEDITTMVTIAANRSTPTASEAMTSTKVKPRWGATLREEREVMGIIGRNGLP